MRYYCGVGSRQTPDDVLHLMTRVAAWLETQGFCLRSGGAPGADSAFAAGCTQKEIYVPWRGFTRGEEIVVGEHPALVPIAAQYHPAWDRLKQGARKLHTRNVAQVLGLPPDGSHSTFLMCWTPGATGSGGTGQAIRIARGYDIPVLDLADPEVRARTEKRIM